MKKMQLAAALFLFSSVGFGQVRTWVSPTGLDSNPCTLQQPCRNFAAAIAAVAADGEVVALSSAGYGSVIITKAVSVIAPAGVHAAIAPTTGNGVTVAAGNSDHVVLRNLYLNAQGAEEGIDVDSAAAVFVENSVVSGFLFEGIRFDPSTTGARLYVRSTVVRRSGSHGILVSGGTGLGVTIDSVQLHQNLIGLFVFNAQVTIRQSVASGGESAGWWAHTGTKVLIEDSVSTSNATGFLADDSGIMIMARCAASSNTAGVSAHTSGLIYISDSTVTANTTGVSTATGGVVSSRGNNTL